jgi:hypothetical protein
MTDTIHSQNFIQEPYINKREQQIRGVMSEITSLLLAKNVAYGDSALSPSNIFSKLNAVEAIKIRIDDKLKRIANKGITDQTEDTVSDLIGYLVLLKIALKEE